MCEIEVVSSMCVIVAATSERAGSTSNKESILVSRIYYQDPELHLRELCYDHSGNTEQWILGEQVLELCLSMNGHPSHF